MTPKPLGVRLNQALLLVAGAVFLALVVAPDDDRFYWTPLALGLALLSAALVGGRDDGHWAPACALTGWGAAVVLAGAAQPALDTSGLYLVGAGLGTVAGLLLARAGYAVDAMALALTIAAGGLVLALTTQLPALEEAWTYAGALAALAVAELALGAATLQRKVSYD